MLACASFSVSPLLSDLEKKEEGRKEGGQELIPNPPSLPSLPSPSPPHSSPLTTCILPLFACLPNCEILGPGSSSVGQGWIALSTQKSFIHSGFFSSNLKSMLSPLCSYFFSSLIYHILYIIIIIIIYPYSLRKLASQDETSIRHPLLIIPVTSSPPSPPSPASPLGTGFRRTVGER